jgi:hypothetical protein
VKWFLLLLLPNPEANAVEVHAELESRQQCEAQLERTNANPIFRRNGVVLRCVEAECAHLAYRQGERIRLR